MRRLRIAVLLAAMMPATAVRAEQAAAQPSAETPKTGAFSVSFIEPSPHSAFDQFKQRLRVNITPDIPTYNIIDETFEAYVPESYDGTQAYGLLVYIDPGGRGRVPRGEWIDVLSRHKLIWIAANNTGNRRHVLHRIGIALDAAHNMMQRYKIDERRVYISGMSGGSRAASWLGLNYPEVFTGMLTICGVDFYRTIPVPGKAGYVWKNSFREPAAKILNQVRTMNRHVLLTGSDDFNREVTDATARMMRAQRFRHVTYLEVPGMGHRVPDAEWFEKAIATLDEPAVKP